MAFNQFKKTTDLWIAADLAKRIGNENILTEFLETTHENAISYMLNHRNIMNFRI